MRFDDEVLIAAPPERVWSVYSDVEGWPQWTASVSEVTLLTPGPLAVGSRARIRQPRLPKAEWTVTEIEPGRSWTWVATGPGVRTTAVHALTPEGDGTRVHQTIVQGGLLGGLVGRMWAKLTHEYLAMEAAGLKQRCEQG